MASTVSIHMANTSSSNHFKKEPIDTHFRWASLYKFIVLASVFNSMYLDCIDIFSKEGELPVTIFETLLIQILVGAPYMFMDCFIRQYTKKMDGYTLLNPLLRGIQFGVFLQTALVAILSSLNLIDTWRYFGASLKEVPSWNVCNKKVKGKCISLNDLYYKCYYQSHNLIRSNLTSTSAHHHYLKMFMSTDRNTMTLKAFFSLVVWIVNFFIATVADETFLKICRLIHWIRIIFTISLITGTLITVRDVAFEAFGDMMAWDGEIRSVNVMRVVTFAYSMGMLSFYDYDALSPYTMTDNAVMFYMIEFNIEGMIRSWIFSSIVVNLKDCVIFPEHKVISNHYYLFCIIPLGGELMPVSRVYTLYIYIQMLLGITTRLSMMTLSMAKLLQSEFRSVKIIYIVGLVCFTGISLTVPFALYFTSLPDWFFKGAWKGFDLATAVVAFLKVFIVVFVYGIQRFSKDIHYWLGFKLTSYWALTWTLLPVTCLVMVILISKSISELSDVRAINFAISWLVVTFSLVAILNVRTIALHLMNNVLVRAFVASVKYGPPDPDDRKKRRVFNETIELRRCRHDCHILDEEVDCNHLSLMMSTLSTSIFAGESDSLQDIMLDTSGYKKRPSLIVHIENP